MVLFAAAEPIWANIRIAIAAISFAPLVLLATLLHLDRFHLNTTDSTALVAGWSWLIVYVTVPILFMVLLFQQEQAKLEQ